MGDGDAVALTELGFPVDLAESLEKRGIYDTTRLRERKPEVYQAAVLCLGKGVSAKTTGELLGLDIRTVNAVLEVAEAEGSITPYKSRTVAQLRGIIGLGLDGLMEKAAKGQLSAIDLAVLIDKLELLSGGVTARVEQVTSREADEVGQFYAGLRQRAGMVLEAEEIGEKGAVGAVGSVGEIEGGQTA